MAVLFKYRAKVHQSEFKKNILKIEDEGCIPMEVTNKKSFFANTKLVCMPHFLSKEDARAGKIYYEPFRKKILEYIELKLGGFDPMRDGNMLKSDHITLNFFIPMADDLHKMTMLLNKFLPESPISSIESITIEKNNGKTIKDNNLEGNNSWDVLVNFTHNDGEKGLVGVEVEFTELSFMMKEAERKSIFDHKDKPYQKVSEVSEYYNTDDIEKLILEKLSKDEYRQIWKSHILGASQIMQGNIKYYYNIYLYPNENEHFSKRIPEYQTLLTSKGKDTMIPITFEQFFQRMEEIFNENEVEINWIDYLKQRYLVN